MSAADVARRIAAGETTARQKHAQDSLRRQQTLADAKLVPYDQLDTWHLMVFRMRLEWLERARPDQLPPEDGWSLWLFIAGRGSGKTRTAAEHVSYRGAWRRDTRVLIAAPTTADIRDTCFEGESGILSVMPERFIRKWNRSLGELILKNDTIFKGLPLSEPERQRGPQWHCAWVDELAAAEKNKVDLAWKNLTLAVRLKGYRAEKLVTTTPKPIALMRDLMKRKNAIITRATTYDNTSHLEDEFKEEVLKFEGTKYGDQEIYGELLDPSEAGIIKRSWFKLWAAKDARTKKAQRLPRFKLIVQSYDTAYGEKEMADDESKGKEPDYTACVVFGIFEHPVSKKHQCMVVDAWHDRLGYPELRAKVFDEFKKGKYGNVDDAKGPDVLLIEQKSSGISIIQDLANQDVNAFGYNPGRLDKYQRLNLVSYIPYHGLVWIPESAKPELAGMPRAWAEPFLECVTLFPNVAHDDYADAFSQGMQYLADQGWIEVKNPHIVVPTEKDYHAAKMRRSNPYAR